MKVLADTHCHIYSCYNLEEFLKHTFKNLENAYQSHSAAYKLIFLTQTPEGSLGFAELEKRISLLEAYSVHTVVSGLITRVECKADGSEIYLVNGKQIVSLEGLEILALVCPDSLLPQGSAAEILTLLNTEKIPCVLPWSPGKWRNQRAELVRKELLNNPAIMLGDIAMRARHTLRPALYRLADSKGIRILAGSDSLPLEGEEQYAGKYASVFEVADDFQPTPDEIREMLANSRVCSTSGRNNIIEACRRWIRLFLRRVA